MSKRPDQAPEPSAKMQMCSNELKEVLARYDVAAVVVLHEPAQVVYFVKLDPSYSLASMKDNKLILGKGLPDLLNPDGPPKGAADTVNMFRNMCGLLRNVLSVMTQSLMSSQVFYNLVPKGGPSGAPHLNGKQQRPPQN